MTIAGHTIELVERLDEARNNLRKELEEVFPGQNITVDRIIDGIEELINAKRNYDRY